MYTFRSFSPSLSPLFLSSSLLLLIPPSPSPPPSLPLSFSPFSLSPLSPLPLPLPLSLSFPPSPSPSPPLPSPSKQTYLGSILSAVNPYKSIDGLYSNDKMELYMDKQLGELPPHIFAIANEVYVSMWRMRHNQCVLIRSVRIQAWAR